MLSREHWHWPLPFSPSLSLSFPPPSPFLFLALAAQYFISSNVTGARPMHPRLKSKHEKVRRKDLEPFIISVGSRREDESVGTNEAKGLLIIHSSWRAFTFPTSAELFLHRAPTDATHDAHAYKPRLCIFMRYQSNELEAVAPNHV